jgi:hypothetical protein
MLLAVNLVSLCLGKLAYCICLDYLFLIIYLIICPRFMQSEYKECALISCIPTHGKEAHTHGK